jgi:serine/threonine-protein kinase
MLRAHHLYLKGRFHWNRRDPESLTKAIGYFERAIDELPSYARAYAGLADSFAMLGVYGAQRASDVMPKSKEAANRALALDDDLAEVYVSRALVRSHYERDFGRAEADFRQALELNPNYATAHQQYAMTCLIPTGRFDEAFRALRQAQWFDPMSVPICVSLGLCFYFSRQYAKAAEEFARALEIEDDFIRVRVFLAAAYEQQDQLDEALVAVLTAEGKPSRGPTVLSALGRIYSKLDYRDRAGQILNQLLDASRQRYVTPTLIAQLYVGLGEKQLALDALQRAYELRSADLIWLGVHPLYDPLRAEPEFQGLLGKLGLGQSDGDGKDAQRPD